MCESLSSARRSFPMHGAAAPCNPCEPMNRRIFKLGLVLLLGAIINVAVAWACALLAFPASWKACTVESHEWRLISVDNGFGSEWISRCNRVSDDYELSAYCGSTWWNN